MLLIHAIDQLRGIIIPEDVKVSLKIVKCEVPVRENPVLNFLLKKMNKEHNEEQLG